MLHKLFIHVLDRNHKYTCKTPHPYLGYKTIICCEMYDSRDVLPGEIPSKWWNMCVKCWQTARFSSRFMCLRDKWYMSGCIYIRNWKLLNRWIISNAHAPTRIWQICFPCTNASWYLLPILNCTTPDRWLWWQRPWQIVSRFLLQVHRLRFTIYVLLWYIYTC